MPNAVPLQNLQQDQSIDIACASAAYQSFTLLVTGLTLTICVTQFALRKVPEKSIVRQALQWSSCGGRHSQPQLKMSLGWKKFTFFEKEEVAEHSIPDDISCSCSSMSHLFVGTSSGDVRTRMRMQAQTRRYMQYSQWHRGFCLSHKARRIKPFHTSIRRSCQYYKIISAATSLQEERCCADDTEAEPADI